MIRFGLVGCGRIAKRHAQLLGTKQITGAQLGAVCDVEESRAKSLGQEFGIPYFTDMDELVEKAELDAISVLTPSGQHAEHVIRLAKYGLPIVVEKPMALTLDDADAMIHACDHYGSRLFVVKQNRFNVPVVKLRQALEQGRFDELVMGTVRVRWCRRQEYYDNDSWRGKWATDGGVLANQASHHVDLLEWMMGDVESVVAKGLTALVDIEAEDTAVAVLKFRNGALGIIEATTATRPTDLEGSSSILGSGGTVVIAGFAVNQIETWEFEDSLPEDELVRTEFSVNPPNVYGFGHKAYYDHVVQCLQTSTGALVDGMQGRRSLELISAIYESIETGKEVHLRFKPERCRLGLQP